MSRSIAFVSNGDDWEAIYVDGEVWRQGHDIRARDWLELLEQFGGVTTSERHVDTEQSHEMGCFPDLLKDVR